MPDYLPQKQQQHHILLFSHLTVCHGELSLSIYLKLNYSPGLPDNIPLCRYILTYPTQFLIKFTFFLVVSMNIKITFLCWLVGYELSPKDSCMDKLDPGGTLLKALDTGGGGGSFLMPPCCALRFLCATKCGPLCSMLLLLGLLKRTKPTSDWMFWNIESDIFPPLSCFCQEFGQCDTKAGNTMVFSQRDLSDSLWGRMVGLGMRGEDLLGR